MLKFRYTNPGVGYLDGRYVNITGDTMTGALVIDGSANEVQLLVKGHSTQNTNIVEIQEDGSTVVHSISGTGAALFQNFTDSTTAFQVLTKADGGDPLFNIDTVNERIGISKLPAEKLDIGEGHIRIFNTIAGRGNPQMHFWLEGVDRGYLNAGTGKFDFRALGTVDFAVKTSNNVGALVELLTIEGGSATDDILLNPTGNVGITKVGPIAKLHLAGNSDQVQVIFQANATQTANILEIQDSSNNVLLNVTGGGDLEFEAATSGLIFGSMYIPGVDIVVSTGDANPHEVADGSGDGWSASQLNGVTFPTGGTEHYLTVPKAGKYDVVWSLSGHSGSGGATAMHGGIAIDGTAQRNDGEAHGSVTNSNIVVDIGAPCIVDCPNGTEQISVWVAVDNSADFHAEHGTITIKQIGGT